MFHTQALENTLVYGHLETSDDEQHLRCAMRSMMPIADRSFDVGPQADDLGNGMFNRAHRGGWQDCTTTLRTVFKLPCRGHGRRAQP
eukprot:3261743-Amphidinium_carterae.2